MSPLTEEQKKRINENRLKALARREAALNQNKNITGTSNSNYTSNLSKPSSSFKPTIQSVQSSNSSLSSFNNRPVTSLTNQKNGNVMSISNYDSNSNVVKNITTASQSSSKTFSLNTLSKTSTTNNDKGINTNTFFGSKVMGCTALISKDRFLIDMPYQAQAIEIFKNMPSRQYDASTKKWSFHLNDHSKLMTSLNTLRPQVCISPLPDYVLQVIRKSYKPLSSIDLSSLDPQLLEAFFPFQREGVAWAISRSGRVLIADDMGLGKTIQALGIASYYRNEWPLVIICPASVRYSWADAVTRWLPSICSDEIAVLDTSKDYIDDAQVIICSYDLISKRLDDFKSAAYKVLILDESHMIKCFKTARFKAIDPLIRISRRCIMLSGTPALSRPVELYNQINGVDKSLFPTHQIFGIRYCAGKKNNFGWDFTGSSNMEELQILLQNTVMLRRLKSEVIDQLPPKTRNVTVLDPSTVKLGRKDLETAAKNFGSKNLKGAEKHGALLSFFAESAHAKLKAVSEYMKDLIEAGQKFLIFAHHRVMLDKICDTCDKTKTKYIRIDGSTSSDLRNQMVDMFQTQEDIKVAVLSIVAASTGITLTAANLVVFAELYWNPGILAQAEDRAHRIGQQDCVTVEYLIARGTSDDHIWSLVQDKLNVLGKVGLSKDNFSNSSEKYQTSKDQLHIDDFLNIDFDDDTWEVNEPYNKKIKI